MGFKKKNYWLIQKQTPAYSVIRHDWNFKWDWHLWSDETKIRTFQTLLLVLHWNLAEWSHPGQRASFAGIPALQSRLHHRVNGKTRGGGLCFYINEGWCSDVTTLKKMCSPNLETLFLNCKPFYSPREFYSFILVNVYHVSVSAAMQKLAEQISEMEQRYPVSLLIILGDFNKKRISHVNCKNTDSTLHVPPETVIYWITVTQ